MTEPSRRFPFALRLGALALLSGSTAFAALPARAQDADDTAKSTVLQAINVKGGDDADTSIVAHETDSSTKMPTSLLDTPAAVSVVTAKSVQDRDATNMQQVLSYTAGVNVNEYGSDSRYDYFRIRGFSEMELGTYRDGLPVRGAGWTFMRLQPYAFDRFDVVKGSNSSLFGLNAPGGLVNATTKMPKDHSFGHAYVTAGNHLRGAGVDFGGPLGKSDVWSYRVTAKVQNGDTGASDSRDDQRYVGLALRYQPDSTTRLTFMADYSSYNTSLSYPVPLGSGISPETFLGEPDFNYNKGQSRSLGYRFDHEFGGGLSLHQTARYTWFELEDRQVYPSSSDPTADRDAFSTQGRNRQFAIDTRLQYDTMIGNVRSRTLAGVEYDWFSEQEVDLYGSAPGTGSFTDPTYCGLSCITLGPYMDWTPSQTSKALYLQQELTFQNRWIVTLGARYDHVTTEGLGADGGMTSRRDNNISKRLGVTYKITPELSAYANYSQSFQPNFWDVDAGPKEGRQVEVGMKFRPQNFNGQFGVSAFDLTQSNVSTYVSPTVQEQIGKVRVRGVELEGKTALTDRINLTAAYSWWDAKITADGSYGTGGSGSNLGNRPALVPTQVASLWADYTLPGNARRGDMTFGLGVRFVGTSYADDANTLRNKAHTVVDALYRYGLTQNVDLSVNVSNLFDKKYIATTYGGMEYYGPRRSISATVRYSW
ncbi:TonB-dependent siderophore receptor [Acidimangrovimonas sediminis]|uniref:TonB-dependent siderophore receptor n=1 Tax=Acidimangrovimonas sediminis TaxID=2056283 RepID=UPI000C7F8289|nr:TonB-dependent siderophore receptor [Acidimangrovimonas sediminis]